MTHFYLTDVFAEGPFAGNQLATLPDAADIRAEKMQKIARAFNFSETTFITGGDPDAGFDVRIFTPTDELPFAGHPTLGTAFVIREEILGTGVPEIRLNLGVGQIPVTFGDDGVAWMHQKPPEFGDVMDSQIVAKALNLDPADIDGRHPIQFVSTGLEFLMVPLRSLAALQSAKLVDERLAQGVFVFCPQGYEQGQTMAARMFAAAMGVSEDPATGSANGCLAGYLVEHRYFNSDTIDVRVGQGYEIGRPSQLYLRAGVTNGTDEGIRIEVGGKVRIVAEGDWRE